MVEWQSTCLAHTTEKEVFKKQKQVKHAAPYTFRAQLELDEKWVPGIC